MAKAIVTDHLTAKELEICDDKGRTRLLLSTSNESGYPFVSFRDDHGRERLVIALGDGNLPKISMLRENGRSGAGMGEDATGRVAIALMDRDGAPGILLTIHPDGTRNIEVLSANLVPLWSAVTE